MTDSATSDSGRRADRPRPSREEGLRALMERVAGGSLDSLARKYRTRPEQIGVLLDEKFREEIVESLREQVLRELTPLAIAVLEARLKMGDLEAAKYLLDNFGLARRPSQSLKVSATPPAPNSLEDLRLQIQKRRYQAPGARAIDLTGDSVQ